MWQCPALQPLHTQKCCTSAAVMTAASMPYQLLPDTSDLILLSPRCSQPTTSLTLPDLQLSPFSMQRFSHKLPGLISPPSSLCVSWCDWDPFSSWLPPYSNWEVKDQYSPASSISNLSLLRFSFRFLGFTNPCPKGGISLLLSCCCANQHSCSDG